MQKTPLHGEHEKLGARIVDFNGWALPVQFAGIVNEHHHTRSKVSIFDCSHMGEYRIVGQEAIERFNHEIMSDVPAIRVGRCRYGAILNEAGGIVDDLITFRMAEDELYVVTNAGPIESVTERICGKGPGAEHVSYETAKIDIQGPEAQRVALAVGFEPAKDLKYFQATWTTWEDFPAIISRTGYTGELGYELYVPNALAVTLWNRLLEIEGVAPAGLGARDTLRTEVGYGLSGQDFDENITPLEAGMEPFIAWDTNFVGRQALEAKRQAGDARSLVGIVTHTKRKPQHGFEVFDGERSVGEVTSGTFGPSIGTGVGLARVNRELGSPGTRLTAGPKKLEIEVIEIPAYRDGTARMKL